jgi:hydrogenase expression/formation protein HypC
MCLAVPGRILRLFDADDTQMSDVDFGGVVKQVCLQYIPDAQVGDYVIVHVGFALQKLDEESALATLENFERLGIMEEEFGDGFAQAAKQAAGFLPASATTGAAPMVGVESGTNGGMRR